MISSNVFRLRTKLPAIKLKGIAANNRFIRILLLRAFNLSNISEYFIIILCII
jgi:hypothetical protein